MSRISGILLATVLAIPGLRLIGAEGSGDGTSVTIYKPIVCTVRLVLSSPVVHLRYGDIEGDAKKPDWYDAYIRLVRLDRFEYADWVKYASPQFIKQYAITPQSFVTRKEGFDKERTTSGLSSLLWSVYVTVGERKFCFAVFYDAGFLDELPRSSMGLPNGFIIHSFEFLDGIWKNQPIPETDIARNIPMYNRDQLEAIMAAGSGIIREKLSTPAVPFEATRK